MRELRDLLRLSCEQVSFIRLLQFPGLLASSSFSLFSYLLILDSRSLWVLGFVVYILNYVCCVQIILFSNKMKVF